MTTGILRASALLAAASLLAACGQKEISYRADVQPILKQYCLECHADGGDGWQCWSSLAYAYELTGNALYLQRAEEMLGGDELLPGLVSQGLWNLENRAALLALAQRLAGP